MYPIDGTLMDVVSTSPTLLHARLSMNVPSETFSKTSAMEKMS
jgi:hypothetical protein